MKRFTRLLLYVLLFNVLGMIIHTATLSDMLHDKLFSIETNHMLDAKAAIKKELDATTQEGWKALAHRTAIKYDTDVFFADNETLEPTPITPDDFDTSTEIPTPYIAFDEYGEHEGELIDESNFYLTFPLNNDISMIVGPLTWSPYITYIQEWFSWLLAMVITLLVIGHGIYQYEKENNKLRNAIINFPGMRHKDKKDNDLSELVGQLRTCLEHQAEEQLQRITAQRDLFHGVAHEFRSPLARIQFALDMIGEESPEEREALVGKIDDYLKDLDSLVKELLYYSRITYEHNRLNFTAINIKALVEECVESVKPFYPGVAFNCDIDGDSSLVAERPLVQRLLTNLLRNGGRFASSQCSIAIQQTPTHVSLIVEDDGPGVPPGKKERIFEPFTRLDPSRSRDSGGCGLGLAIVATIAKKHNAKVSVEESHLGGAKFIIHFLVR